MQKVIILKNCKYREGEIIIINANEAHSLIDSGYAVLYKEKEYEDKMMRSKRSKKWQK